MNDYQIICVAVLVFLVVLVVKHSSKSKSSAPAKPYVPPVTLDDAEIQMLGNEAAHWFGNWASSPYAEHKWLVIEI